MTEDAKERVAAGRSTVRLASAGAALRRNMVAGGMEGRMLCGWCTEVVVKLRLAIGSFGAGSAFGRDAGCLRIHTSTSKLPSHAKQQQRREGKNVGKDAEV